MKKELTFPDIVGKSVQVAFQLFAASFDDSRKVFLLAMQCRNGILNASSRRSESE